VNPFRYERARDAAEASVLLGKTPAAMLLGGGTNLVDLMRLRVAKPEALIDVSRATSDRVELLPGGGLRLGAGMRNTDAAADKTLRARYPVLSQALLSGASGQIRNLATVAGNLLQRTRCVYFQDVSKPCNKREPASGCPAREGYHRNLSILGASDACIATHPSDMAVALMALDARVRIIGAGGERLVPLAELYRLPGDEPQRDTTLQHGDVITHVEIPPLEFAKRSRYRKVRDRASFAFALVSVAGALDIRDGMVRDVRLALGGVAHMPWRARIAEEALRGRPAREDTFREAAAAELRAAQPLRDNAFKVPLAQRSIVRTLLELSAEP